MVPRLRRRLNPSGTKSVSQREAGKRTRMTIYPRLGMPGKVNDGKNAINGSRGHYRHSQHDGTHQDERRSSAGEVCPGTRELCLDDRFFRRNPPDGKDDYEIDLDQRVDWRVVPIVSAWWRLIREM